MDNYYAERERLVAEFAECSGLPFSYQYTGGGFCAMSADTVTHRIYITNEDGTTPDVNECHYVGVYSLDADDLMGEIFPNNRAELLATIKNLEIGSLDVLVDFVLECGKFAPSTLGGDGK